MELLAPGDHTGELLFQQRLRTYLVHVPKSYDPKQPLPLVIVFHGGQTTAASMVDFCGMNDVAEREGFIVLYPNGTGQRDHMLMWNAGRCCGYAKDYQVDDVGFIRTLLDRLPRRLPFDKSRVYATGVSNGGMMTMRIAVELADRIAAAASVSGPVEIDHDTARPSRPVPLMYLHGTEDDFVPINGGVGVKSLSRTDFHSVREGVDYWLTQNGCQPLPTSIREIPDTAGDGTRITIEEYSGGAADVLLYIIHGGGHTWPGRKPRFGTLGPWTANLNASDEIWRFFARHRLS